MMGFARLAVAALAAFAIAIGCAWAAPVPDEPTIGIWAAEMTFAPGLHGDLAVARAGNAWRATLGGGEVKFAVTDTQVRFAFPNNGGEFRGALTDQGRAITGFWLQPAGGTSDSRDPGGSGQAFASPLTLQSAAPESWHGAVAPLEDRFTLYLKIYRNADGMLVGAFRNPDFNANGNAGLFRVTRTGDTLQFAAPIDQPTPQITLSATFLHSPERLQIRWPRPSRTFDLARRSPAEAAAFFPRPPGEPKYVYRQPAPSNDGWEAARAGDVGMDETALARLVQRLIDSDPAVRRPALIHSLLVAHHGKLVLEEYFFGFDRDRLHDLRSAGKTFASVMLGAAMLQHLKIAPETKAYELLAGWGPFANPDPRKSRITLAQLMTHTSGLACDDNDDNSPGNEDTTQSQTHQPDWWKYTLDLPMAHDPGSRYAYCSAGMNLMGAALKTATGSWLPEFFDRAIARPLQFGTYYWNLMPTHEGYLGGGAYVMPRDFLKLGQVFLDHGLWRGRRIVDASWVDQSTTSRIAVTPETTGLAADQFSNVYLKAEDGYAWHLSELHVGERAYRDYAASGNGGQLLIVVPELDLTVVFTAGNYGQGGIWTRFRSEIVPQEIIPAIRK